MIPLTAGSIALQGAPVGVDAAQGAALQQLCEAIQAADRGARPHGAAMLPGLQALNAIRSQVGVPLAGAWTGAVARAPAGGSVLTLRYAGSQLELVAHIDVSGQAYMGTLAWAMPHDVINPIGFSVSAGMLGAAVHIHGSAGQVDVPLGAGAPLAGWTSSPTFAPDSPAGPAAGGALPWGAAMGAVVAAAGLAVAHARQQASPGPIAAAAPLAPAPQPQPPPGAVTPATMLIEEPAHAAIAHPAARLVWLTGGTPGRQQPVGETVRLGRGAGHEVDLEGVEPKASRDHAVVGWSGGQLVINDLGSRNGTLVNGHRLVSPMRLNRGDIVSIGAMRWRVEIEETRPPGR